MNQVFFGTIKSYEDLGLFLLDEGVEIETPKAKRQLLSVPGTDGLIDMTPGLGGDTRFENREITLTFVVANYESQWLDIFSDITTRIHGKRFHVSIEPDSDYYWNAFCTVDKHESERNKGTIVIKLDCDPYKYKEHTASLRSPGSTTCTAGRKSVVPTITNSAAVTVTYGSYTATLAAGTNKDTNIVFTEGDNTIMFTGSANVTITYDEGIL